MSRRKKDKDGIYKHKDSPYFWVSFTDASGRRTRKSSGTANRKEAEAILAKWKLEAHRAQHWDEEPERTFDDLMLEYLNETMPNRRSGESRVLSTVRPLYDYFSKKALNEITSFDVRAYIRKRTQQGRAPGTINKEVGLLSAAFNHAVREWGWRVDNPAEGQKMDEPEGRIRWITREEAELLIGEAERTGKAPHLGDFIRLALHTGMRCGEILGLEWSRVDLWNGLIHLDGIHTKTGKRRAVPMNAVARQAMHSRARFRAAHCPASPWVFCKIDGDRLKNVRRSFQNACRRAGIEDFRIHDLRHTCAAWLVSVGVPLAEVRDLLGHRTIQMTERYAHLAPENVRAAVATLETKSRFGHAGQEVT